MKVGIIVPQGWTGEYAGVEPAQAWKRSLAVAREAEQLGFESLWVFDHFQTVPEPLDEITFESFTLLTAVAGITNRVSLGHLVLCAGFRNPALTAKMISTLDVASGGRAEVGIGAGWKQDEWEAYGYGFPSRGSRMGALRDSLEVIRRMLHPGRATYDGMYASVAGAINEPKGIRPTIPILVGGNGREVTWRLAARYADELNLNQISPDDAAAALPVVRDRCAEIDRDPGTLAVSMHYSRHEAAKGGAERVETLARYREVGLSRVMVLVQDAVRDEAALAAFAEDCVQAGVNMVRSGREDG